MRVHFSPESIRDLERLREFIAVKNPHAAKRIAQELLTGIDKLKIFPKMGLPVLRAPDPEQVRDLFLGPYTVRYLIAKEEIFILRLWHGKEGEKDL